jgi:hypothetical protein
MRCGVGAAIVAVFAACGGELMEVSSGGPPSQGDDAGTGAQTQTGDASTSSSSSSSSSKDAGRARAGGPDGVCTPGDVTLGVYDPDCVYVVGRSDKTAATNNEVIFHPSNAAVVASGFGDGPFFPDPGAIRPSDGAYLFVSARNGPWYAYTFVPTAGPPTSTTPRPIGPLGTPACPQYLRSVRVFPDTSEVIYECIYRGDHWYTIETTTLFDVGDFDIIALGAGRTALVRGLGATTLTLLDGATQYPVTLIEGDKIHAARSKPGGGFQVVAVTAADVYQPKLYSVAPDGTATELGSYNMGSIEMGAMNALEPDGAVVTIATLQQPFTEGVVRLRTNATPEVLYDERTGSWEVTAGLLVTGP